jgi:hypothetical protein
MKAFEGKELPDPSTLSLVSTYCIGKNVSSGSGGGSSGSSSKAAAATAGGCGGKLQQAGVEQLSRLAAVSKEGISFEILNW